MARVLHNATSLDVKNILIPSPTLALLKLPSADDAASFVQNSAVQTSLATLQRQILRLHPAKREVVHDKYSGPVRQVQLKKMTHKLVVDGDTPSRDFCLESCECLASLQCSN